MWSVRNGPAAAAAAGVAAVGAAARNRAAPSHGTSAGRRWRQNPEVGGASGGLFLLKGSLCRALHCSASCCGSRHLLKKFMSKHKKKFWYDSPTLGPHLVYKPSSLANVLNLAPPKVKKEDSKRKRVLDILLVKAVRDVLSTCEAGQEAYDLRVELSKASLTPDFSICRVYWRTTDDAEQDDYMEKVLQKSAPRIRHLLITNQVLGTVPSIVFLRDKEDAAVREIEHLLTTIDFGPLDEENELDQNDLREQRSTVTVDSLDPTDSSIHSNLFGIDHEAFNKQIAEYKQMKKNKEIEGIALSEQQQEQLAEIRKQNKMRWKKTKKPSDNDITPQKYLMDKYNDDYGDSEAGATQESELEDELQEIENELEVDHRNHTT